MDQAGVDVNNKENNMTFKKLFIGLALTASSLVLSDAMAQAIVETRTHASQDVTGTSLVNGGLVDRNGTPLRGTPKRTLDKGLTNIAMIRNHKAEAVREGIAAGTAGAASSTKAIGTVKVPLGHKERGMETRRTEPQSTHVAMAIMKGVNVHEEHRFGDQQRSKVAYGLPEGAQHDDAVSNAVLTGAPKTLGFNADGKPIVSYRSAKRDRTSGEKAAAGTSSANA